MSSVLLLCYVLRCDSCPMVEMAWRSCVCPWIVFAGFDFGFVDLCGGELLSLVMVLGGGMMSDFQSSPSQIELGYFIVIAGILFGFTGPGKFLPFLLSFPSGDSPLSF